MPTRAAGRLLFRAGDVATWLDRRTVATDDLKEGEAPGTTYGARFRKNLSMPIAATRMAGNLGVHLWAELEKQRGATDIVAITDLVLALLYLRVIDLRTWAGLARSAEDTARRPVITRLVDQGMIDHGMPIPHLPSVLPAQHAGDTPDGWLAAIVALIDHASPSSSPYERQRVGDAIAAAFTHLLDRLAAVEGQRTSEYFTPDSIVRVAVELTAPSPGDTIYDPCCGAGAFLVGVVDYARRRGISPAALSLTGIALGDRSWRTARMNLAVRGASADLGPHQMSTLRQNLHGDRPFDLILSNPPFNMPAWADRSPEHDSRWRY